MAEKVTREDNVQYVIVKLGSEQYGIDIKYVDNIDKAMAYAGDAGTARGTGGMRAKLEAAKICTSAGIPMIIANGADPEILYDIEEGNFVGTYIDVKKA